MHRKFINIFIEFSKVMMEILVIQLNFVNFGIPVDPQSPFLCISAFFVYQITENIYISSVNFFKQRWIN
jgi:hypothetical protein